jgi:predicted metal-dependent peptidase
MKVLPSELQTARFALTRSHAYMSSLMLSLNFIEEPGLGTMGVDKHWRCYYDPAVLQKWTKDELKGVLFHECNHLLRSHPERSEFFENKHKMNIAEDVEINPDVFSSGLKLPPGCDRVIPETFGLQDGMLAEEIYHKLPEQPGQGGQGKEATRTAGAGWPRQR